MSKVTVPNIQCLVILLLPENILHNIIFSNTDQTGITIVSREFFLPTIDKQSRCVQNMSREIIPDKIQDKWN